eukprot:852073-Alexandrium_andersonii.AAC.1
MDGVAEPGPEFHLSLEQGARPGAATSEHVAVYLVRQRCCPQCLSGLSRSAAEPAEHQSKSEFSAAPFHVVRIAPLPARTLPP